METQSPEEQAHMSQTEQLEQPEQPAPKKKEPSRLHPPKNDMNVVLAKRRAERDKYTMYRMQMALEYYKAMGPGRSLPKLSEVLHREWPENPPSVHTLYDWSKQYHWPDLVLKHDKEVLAEKERRRREDIERINADHLNYGTKMLLQAKDQIERLIESGKMGSQATVQLFKIAADMQRLALGADKPEKNEAQDIPIRVIIQPAEADGAPTASAQIGEGEEYAVPVEVEEIGEEKAVGLPAFILEEDDMGKDEDEFGDEEEFSDEDDA